MSGAYRYWFTTPFTEFRERIGQEIEVLRPLTEDDPVDLEDTGPMYKIRFLEDDLIVTVFEDEIVRTVGEVDPEKIRNDLLDRRF